MLSTESENRYNFSAIWQDALIATESNNEKLEFIILLFVHIIILVILFSLQNPFVIEWK